MQKDNISLLFKLLHKLILIAPLTILSLNPIALKTWLADILPEEHAEPELTSYPSISKAITKLSAEIFLKAINEVFATLGEFLPIIIDYATNNYSFS